jgi:hypothetical protein
MNETINFVCYIFCNLRITNTLTVRNFNVLFDEFKVVEVMHRGGWL